MNAHETIRRVEEYSKRKGRPPSHVAREATNNPRLWDRLKRRVDRLERDVRLMEEYMASNPIADEGGDASAAIQVAAQGEAAE